MKDHAVPNWSRTPATLAAVLVLLTAGIVVLAQPAPAQGQEDRAAARELLRDGTGLYPRVIRLAHGGAENGRVLASVVSFVDNANGIGAIYESTDDGASFTEVGTVADPEAADGQGLCCATLYELPRQIGEMPAGTLLWAASVGAEDRPMALRIWKSNDIGRSWSYLSSCAVATNDGGLWEPEFSIDADGQLVCHYADETDPGHSQKLVATRSADGVTWSAPVETVASNDGAHRPGMPVVRQLPDSSYLMSYEICALGGQYDCSVYVRHSANGWDWGDPAAHGTRVYTVEGKYFSHAPTIAWGPSASNENGNVFLIGQILQNPDGSVGAGNGSTIFVNSEAGNGSWNEIEAPVAVTDPYNNFCPNYSSTLLPSVDGTSILEIATDDDGGICRPYFATGVTGSQ